jgi:DNA primase
MPLGWDQVEAMRRKRAPETTAAMRQWSVTSVPALLARGGDPWRGAGWTPQPLEAALTRARPLWGE